MKSIPLNKHEAAAYAAGRLTQIRRVCKPQPYFGKPVFIEGATESFYWKSYEFGAPVTMAKYHSPYGAPGDRLALREAWATATSDAGPCVCYKADYHRWYLPDGDDGSVDYSKYPGGVFANWASDLESEVEGKWESAARMPLWAVRWHPVITAVRLERNDSGVWEWVIDVEGVKA